uniref:Uncharacterized protein n=1 Tax=Rhizophora mucronata TaxID=61149 RepID=A0A2P2NKU8_RHIMU
MWIKYFYCIFVNMLDYEIGLIGIVDCQIPLAF